MVFAYNTHNTTTNKEHTMHDLIDYSRHPLESIYGEYCFSDGVMKERLPGTIYAEMKKTQAGEKDLTLEVAEVVANAMKDWAIEKGVTHFTHWFQPLTGLTAEKHDSFISPTSNGTILMEFSGKELIKGEPDASSFPSGGLRTTFEARGYTAWDTTSPAFIQDVGGIKTLTIPSVFVSFTGEALDKKTPLLRSMEAVNKAAVRVLRALGDTETKRVLTNVGPEQEYFLVDRKLFEKRPDLLLTGRTVFGSMCAKGQEMDDHYFGSIKERVLRFMHDLNSSLWRLGISAKTQHNEVAPNQFEIATVFDTANLSTDRNQLVMKTIRNVAEHHDLVALLHEKPFAGVNGSGKHNNWSMDTDTGYNLLQPGDDPHGNAQFLLFLTAVIKAVDIYAPLLRLSASNAGNDHRLGANEAPPAIVSIFLGEQLSSILDDIAEGRTIRKQNNEILELGVTTLPKFPKDMTDRNRTSPFAFTGNKFEFRMVGSSQTLADANTVLNAAAAHVLNEAADRLESSADTIKEVGNIVVDFYRNHRRVIFNGNGYCDEWVKEAEAAGLPNLKSTVDAVQELLTEESVELFGSLGILSRKELESRYEIYLENYSKQINIEAGMMAEIANRQIVPAVSRYLSQVADSVSRQKSSGIPISTAGQEKLLTSLSENLDCLIEKTEAVSTAMQHALDHTRSALEQAQEYHDIVVPLMAELRECGDNLEKITDRSLWPLPSYEDLLFRL